eukprot:3717924-Amphidinium_carterae.1
MIHAFTGLGIFGVLAGNPCSHPSLVQADPSIVSTGSLIPQLPSVKEWPDTAPEDAEDGPQLRLLSGNAKPPPTISPNARNNKYHKFMYLGSKWVKETQFHV